MKHVRITTLFNSNLSPKTAFYKGYEYIDDVIIDITQLTYHGFLKVLHDHGFKLGIPSRNDYGTYGLYIPKSDFEKETA